MQALHAGLLLVLLGMPVLIPVLAAWPLYVIAPLLAYASLVALIPPLRRSVTWLRVGRLDRWTVAATVGIIVASSTTLVFWFYWERPSVPVYLERLPDLPPIPALVVVLGVYFAVVNATLEEVIWRGVLMEGLCAELGPLAGLAAQAAVFGVMHYHGFPSGVPGVVLASIFGAMLGWLRLRSQGLLAPIIAHIFADATIFVLIIREASW